MSEREREEVRILDPVLYTCVENMEKNIAVLSCVREIMDMNILPAVVEAVIREEVEALKQDLIDLYGMIMALDSSSVSPLLHIHAHQQLLVALYTCRRILTGR